MNREIASALSGQSNRLTRERRTVTAMLHIYCRAQHGRGQDLCEACAPLHTYAMKRLDQCPYGSAKPACVDCPIHCYRADRRQEIRAVMRYAGPRMLWRHPWLALRHLWDGRRSTPPSAREERSASATKK